MEAVTHHQPDAVVLDMGEETEAFQLCAELHDNHPQLPILMIVADEDEAVEQAFQAGATDVISPPIRKRVFLHRVNAMLESHERSRLLERESWAQSIIDHALEGIYRSTVDGRFMLVNSALVNMLGYDTAEEVLALNIGDDLFISPEIRDEMINKFNHADSTESEMVWTRKDGQHIIVKAYGHAVRDSDGNVLYFEGSVLDITARRQAEAALRQSEEELRAQTNSLETINAVADAVYHSLDIQIVLEGALNTVMQYLDISGSSIYLVNETADRLDRVASIGVTTALSNAAQILQLNRSLNGQSVFTGEIVISNDPSHDEHISEAVRQALAEANIHQIIVVPLLFHDKVIGTLSMPMIEGRALTSQERDDTDGSWQDDWHGNRARPICGAGRGGSPGTETSRTGGT